MKYTIAMWGSIVCSSVYAAAGNSGFDVLLCSAWLILAIICAVFSVKEDA